MTIDDVRQKPVSIIISCLTEEDTIRSCCERVAESMPQAEILVVHGGTDKTYDIALEMSKDNPHIVPVKNENDIGKGHAIHVGIAKASHDIMCQWDADLQFAPEDIPAVFLPIFEDKADVVIGSRFMPESDDSGYNFSFFRTVGNWVINTWISILCGTRITDVTTGSKAWTRDAIEKINFRDMRFVYEVEIPVRAHILGLRITQVPVSYHDRQGGESGHGSGMKEFYSIIRCGIMLLLTGTRIRLFGR